MAEEVLKAIVVDDSTVSRRFLERILRKIANVDVIGTASNGKEAVRAVGELAPDVVLLDIEMPVMDGLESLQIIARDHPKTAVLMVSGVTDASRTMQALQFGAIDFIPKPDATDDAEVVLRSHLTRALRIVAAQARKRDRREVRSPAAVRRSAPIKIESRRSGEPTSPIVVIGVSTGGPRALELLIPSRDVLDCPVLIVQPMPKGFTESLASALDRKTKMAVVEAKDGEIVEPGKVLLAPGGQHMRLRSAGARSDGYVIGNREGASQ